MAHDAYRANRQMERFLFSGLPASGCDDFSPHPSQSECDDYSRERAWQPNSHYNEDEEPEGELIATITYCHDTGEVIVKRVDEEEPTIL